MAITLFEKVFEENYDNPEFLYVQNPGNLGDTLIACPIYLLEEFKFLWRRKRTDSRRVEKIIVYSGGGNLVSYYYDCKEAIEGAFRENVDGFVLLPHTVNGHRALIERMDQRFILFLRDLESYRYVKEINPSVQAHLCDDLALLLKSKNVQFLIKKRYYFLAKFLFLRSVGLRAKSRLFRAMLLITRKRLENKFLRKRYSFFRTDIESLNVTTNSINFSENFDLSAVYSSRFTSKEELMAGAGFFLWFIAAYDGKVFTNRLHVAIAGELTGREVVLFDNSYGKNSAVYKKSLQNSLNVCFIS